MSFTPKPLNWPVSPTGRQPDRVEYDVGIESLLLQGVSLSPSQAQEFRGALEDEMSSRLRFSGAREDLIHNSGAGPLTIHLKSTDSPRRIAQSVAQSLFRHASNSEAR